MRSAKILSVALLASVASAACHPHPKPRPPQLGITTVVMLTDRSVHRGELLAVHRDSLVLAIGDTLRWLPFDAMTRVVIDRRVLGIGPALRRMAIVGIGTGLALTIACESVDEMDGCLALLPATVGLALVIGFFAGFETERFRYATFKPPTAEQLRPWARYPQGMPAGFGGGPPE